MLRKKIKKYGGVAGAKLPLVVFLFEGDWLHIDPFSLEGALWGQQAVTFRPGAATVGLGVQEGGLFLPGPNGRPQNTRLSAVVYCRRVWHNDIVHATLNVYHHPAAAHPVGPRWFNGLAQCQTIVRDAEIEITWNYDRDSRMLPLDRSVHLIGNQFQPPSRGARRSLFNPDETEGQRFCSVTLPDISGDKGDGQSGCSLKRECARNMQSVERSKTRFLDQFLGLTEYDRSHLHQFPIGSVFVQS